MSKFLFNPPYSWTEATYFKSKDMRPEKIWESGRKEISDVIDEGFKEYSQAFLTTKGRKSGDLKRTVYTERSEGPEVCQTLKMRT